MFTGMGIVTLFGIMVAAVIGVWRIRASAIPLKGGRLGWTAIILSGICLIMLLFLLMPSLIDSSRWLI
jgi:hypothetical protein